MKSVSYTEYIDTYKELRCISYEERERERGGVGSSIKISSLSLYHKHEFFPIQSFIWQTNIIINLLLKYFFFIQQKYL